MAQPTKAARIFQTVVLGVLLLAVGTFAAWRSGRDLWVALRERQPTALDMDRFDAEYKGHQWLRATGRFVPELMSVRRSTGKYRDREQAYVYVPLVSSTWRQGDPIHVVVGFGPFRRADAETSTRAEIGEGVRTIDVLVGPDQDRERVLERENYAEPFLWTHAYQRPVKTVVAFGFLVLAISIVCGSAYALVSLARRALRRHKLPGTADQGGDEKNSSGAVSHH